MTTEVLAPYSLSELKQAAVARLSALGWSSIEQAPFTAISQRTIETYTVPKVATLFWNTSPAGCSLHGDYESEGINVIANCSVLFTLGDTVDDVRARVERFSRQALANIDRSYARNLYLTIGPSQRIRHH